MRETDANIKPLQGRLINKSSVFGVLHGVCIYSTAAPFKESIG